MLKKRDWGSWDDPLARATRGLRRPSLDARSWDHPTNPNKVTARCGLAWDKARLGVPGLGGVRSLVISSILSLFLTLFPWEISQRALHEDELFRSLIGHMRRMQPLY